MAQIKLWVFFKKLLLEIKRTIMDLFKSPGRFPGIPDIISFHPLSGYWCIKNSE